MSLYILDGIPLEGAELAFHTRMIAAALSGAATMDRSSGSRGDQEQDATSAIDYADTVLRIYRRRSAKPYEPSYRLTRDERAIDDFIWKEQGQKKAQIDVLVWMRELGMKATHAEIRIHTGAGDASIIALCKRGLLVKHGPNDKDGDE